MIIMLLFFRLALKGLAEIVESECSVKIEFVVTRDFWCDNLIRFVDKHPQYSVYM